VLTGLPKRVDDRVADQNQLDHQRKQAERSKLLGSEELRQAVDLTAGTEPL